jgi:hypothetical protein
VPVRRALLRRSNPIHSRSEPTPTSPSRARRLDNGREAAEAALDSARAPGVLQSKPARSFVFDSTAAKLDARTLRKAAAERYYEMREPHTSRSLFSHRSPSTVGNSDYRHVQNSPSRVEADQFKSLFVTSARTCETISIRRSSKAAEPCRGRVVRMKLDRERRATCVEPDVYLDKCLDRQPSWEEATS